jgi:glycine betaine/proline transport system ATP-binding protein
MDGACRPIANGWKDEPVIDIAGLYKIFGGDPAGALLLVRGKGIRRAELLEKHNSVLALKDVTLSMPARRIQVIMGLSGSGKSTLIRHINRLVEPTAGRVTVDGEDVLALSKPALREFRRRKTAMVFQRFALLPHRTVAQNVAYGLAIQGRGAEEIKRLTAYWLDRVGLGGQGDRYPGQLSGGMQQRVGLARALATDAEILLMDEPFSALDPLIRRDMQDMLLALQAELHKTIVFITHDLDEALKLGDKIAILKDGRLSQVGNPKDILLNPADDYVAAFVRDVNRARVLTVDVVMRPPRLRLTTENIDAALREMRGSVADYGYVFDGEKFRGIVTEENLMSAAKANGGGSVYDMANITDTVTADSVLEEALPTILQSDHPVAVVDDDGEFSGVISKQQLIRVLT